MWVCTVDGCGNEERSADELLVHQAAAHEGHACGVCGTVVPDGYFAIRHVLTEHSRAEYVRAYDANADAVRERETVKEAVEDAADLEAVLERVDESSDGALPDGTT